MVLSKNARCPQQQALGKSATKEGLLLTDPINYMAHLGPPREVTGRESSLALGSPFIDVKGGGLGFCKLTVG